MSATVQSNKTLVAALIATVVMLFTALAAAFLEQRATPDFGRMQLPNLLWINTFVLAVSSVTIEVARRKDSAGSRRWVLATLGLGLLFLVGQIAAFLELRGRGIYVPSTRYGSFVYLMTALHGLHLAAGLFALLYAAARPHVLAVCAIFWHFLGGVWVYVLGVLTVL